MSKRGEKLNDRQILFCQYFVRCFNATKAYMKAYPDCGYKTAMANSVKLMKKPLIIKQIKELKQDKLNQLQLDKYSLVQRYIDIAFADINDFVKVTKKRYIERDENGVPLINNHGEYIYSEYTTVEYNTKDVDGTVIREISQGKNGIKIKLEDKMKALEWLSQHMDLLTTYQKEKLQIEKEGLELRKKQAEKDDWMNE